MLTLDTDAYKATQRGRGKSCSKSLAIGVRAINVSGKREKAKNVGRIVKILVIEGKVRKKRV